MGASMNFNFGKVVGHFTFAGTFFRVESYGFGHINDTFAVYFTQADGSVIRYILQRINHSIFKDPVGLMRNIEGVTDHLCRKIVACGGNPDRETLTLIPTTAGAKFHKDEDGNYWRAYVFIEEAETYQLVEKPEDFYQSARSFGQFQNLLADYPAQELSETIPNFHHTAKRYATFLAAVEANAAGRADAVREEIAFVTDRAADTHVLVDLLEKGELPLRVTHNDTKLNNIMIDNTSGEGICVIDLDTVMPGLSLYDYGDSIRFGASTGAEDEKDLGKITMSLDLFDIYTRGFLETAGEALTPLEIRMLPMGAKMMTFECGMRFLTDYLQGDTYFRIHRPEHNLDRCRTQFKLVADMEAKMESMNAIVAKYAKGKV